MYRELIEEQIRHHDWARLQEPCPEEEIERAEALVGYPFPEELKELLRETNGDRWLLMSAEQIIETVRLNREILAECFDNREEFEEKIDRHIFFATNGCGDYYGYRILPDGKVDTTALYIWEHETFEHRIVAGDICDLILRYYGNEI